MRPLIEDERVMYSYRFTSEQETFNSKVSREKDITWELENPGIIFVEPQQYIFVLNEIAHYFSHDWKPGKKEALVKMIGSQQDLNNKMSPSKFNGKRIPLEMFKLEVLYLSQAFNFESTFPMVNLSFQTPFQDFLPDKFKSIRGLGFRVLNITRNLTPKFQQIEYQMYEGHY